MLERYQRVYAAVDLSAVLWNMEQMHANLTPGTQIIGVIKTDGYGHGAVPIGRELESLPLAFIHNSEPKRPAENSDGVLFLIKHKT